MKEEILRVMTFNTKGLPRKKGYLYTLGSLLFYSVYTFTITHLGLNLPFGIFFVIWGASLLMLLCLYYFLEGTVGLEKSHIRE